MNKTQKHLIIYITRDVIGFISQDNNMPIDTAMEAFFGSQTFELLQDTENGLYTESASYVYEMYKSAKEEVLKICSQ